MTNAKLIKGRWVLTRWSPAGEFANVTGPRALA